MSFFKTLKLTKADVSALAYIIIAAVAGDNLNLKKSQEKFFDNTTISPSNYTFFFILRKSFIKK